MNAPPGTAGALLDARYLLGPVLARGGMSTVHRGLDTRLDRPVAIKIMEPRMAADPVFRTRFEREALSAARIDHPHVVDVHDRGRCTTPAGEQTLFLVMELVEGGTLRDVLRRRGSLGVPASVAVLEPVLDGLAQAHRLGMVHRDVKPENVLISDEGAVKVADFGLVASAAQAGVSHAGMILGTMAYLSPEQVATGQADSRSDVYAAGILLYEMLVGAPPYVGDNALSVAYRHVNDDVPAPSDIASEVPPELDALVRRATSRDPSRRPVDAAAFLAEVRALSTELAIPRVLVPVPPPPPVDQQETVPASPVPLAAIPEGPRGTRTYDRADEDLTARVGEGRGGEGPVGEGRAARRRREAGRSRSGQSRSGQSRSGQSRSGQSRSGQSRSGRSGTADPPDHRIARRRSRRVFAAWIAVLLILGLAVGASAWWFGSGRWTSMPSVIGLDRSAAERMLADADLTYKVTEERHDDVAADKVAAADPAPSARLLRGSAVTLTVSTGRPVVPAIAAGTAVDAAQQTLRAAQLAPVTSNSAQEYSTSVPQGAVVRTDPPAGAALPIGGTVTLVLSRGTPPPPQVTVPSVVGERLDDAQADLAAAGLKADVRSSFPFGRRNGRVIDQEPSAGEKVDRGTTVSLDTF
ncbi:hypothetical protein GCM10009836_14870 [Pseudonocardia ailaonensis]|uniref:non-specific serine/threonine protein kinase n=1 Tax=Pseudonocardia ailaonensis TaxID=367279 RepID=A0ABN2MSI0_9PSEU